MKTLIVFLLFLTINFVTNAQNKENLAVTKKFMKMGFNVEKLEFLPFDYRVPLDIQSNHRDTTLPSLKEVAEVELRRKDLVKEVSMIEYLRRDYLKNKMEIAQCIQFDTLIGGNKYTFELRSGMCGISHTSLDIMNMKTLNSLTIIAFEKNIAISIEDRVNEIDYTLYQDENTITLVIREGDERTKVENRRYKKKYQELFLEKIKNWK